MCPRITWFSRRDRYSVERDAARRCVTGAHPAGQITSCRPHVSAAPDRMSHVGRCQCQSLPRYQCRASKTRHPREVFTRFVPNSQGKTVRQHSLKSFPSSRDLSGLDRGRTDEENRRAEHLCRCFPVEAARAGVGGLFSQTVKDCRLSELRHDVKRNSDTACAKIDELSGRLSSSPCPRERALEIELELPRFRQLLPERPQHSWKTT